MKKIDALTILRFTDPNPSEKEIKKRYHTLALEYHPDLHKSSENSKYNKLFIDLNNAYNYLLKNSKNIDNIQNSSDINNKNYKNKSDSDFTNFNNYRYKNNKTYTTWSFNNDYFFNNNNYQKGFYTNDKKFYKTDNNTNINSKNHNIWNRKKPSGTYHKSKCYCCHGRISLTDLQYFEQEKYNYKFMCFNCIEKLSKRKSMIRNGIIMFAVLLALIACIRFF